MEITMSKEQYIHYLKTQIFWLEQLAIEIEKGEPESTWAVDFEMLKPSIIKE